LPWVTIVAVITTAGGCGVPQVTYPYYYTLTGSDMAASVLPARIPHHGLFILLPIAAILLLITVLLNPPTRALRQFRLMLSTLASLFALYILANIVDRIEVPNIPTSLVSIQPPKAELGLWGTFVAFVLTAIGALLDLQEK